MQARIEFRDNFKRTKASWQRALFSIQKAQTTVGNKFNALKMKKDT